MSWIFHGKLVCILPTKYRGNVLCWEKEWFVSTKFAKRDIRENRKRVKSKEKCNQKNKCNSSELDGRVCSQNQLREYQRISERIQELIES